MAVPADRFKDVPRNVLVTDQNIIDQVLVAITGHHIWKERSELEEDPNFRQPIPYCLVTDGIDKFVLMQRMKGQGEARLLGKRYVGAGGHIEEGHNLFYTALKEVTEEIGLPMASLELEGVIITTGGPVEDVHVGLFYVATTNYFDSPFTSPEGALHEAKWVEIDDLKAAVPEMERWSQVVVKGWFDE